MMDLKIKIFGVGSMRDRVMMQSVEMALNELGVASPIEYISSLDEFMVQGLSGIPALKINGEIIADGRTPSVSELKKQIRYFLDNEAGAL